ncbi:MAG: Glutathione import ATP-binding protein GsiA [Paracidovorax wautersii]|uniref:Glutathione import ATP-binding protein GsiA n=1 Tax=Paracidovorax wautersii TaxID=1177982 RepID=A0A7V8FRT7_9BURK|nr:MAG: Glutathione import ATP-binding protein GsiA [Paracidovorax wautersii]
MTSTSPTPLVRIENLSIAFRDGRTERTVVSGLSLTIYPGESVALVGESGSGKSVTARALVGLNGARAIVRADRFEIGGQNVLRHGERQWRRVRGSQIGFVLQDALVSLDPLCRIRDLLGEVLRVQTDLPRRAIGERSAAILRAIGIPDPERRLPQYPHQLSGGLRQRALIGTAIAGEPALLIADEPTTALDMTVQQQILELLKQRRALGNALLLISHDLAVVSELADHVLVMKAGEVVEQGRTRDVLLAPRHAYTRQLLQAVPTAESRGWRLSPAADDAAAARTPLPPKRIDHRRPVLVAENLVKRYGTADDAPRAVDDVSFTLSAGETLGIVGESGSGKTTVARIVLGLTQPDGGRVLLDGQPWSELRERERRPRRAGLQFIAQDPYSSFDPRYTVGRIIGESLDTVQVFGDARRQRVLQLLDEVRLGPAYYDRYPRELSGGQRQRVAIARAFAPNPALLVADEPVSALDVSIQAQVLDLLAELQAEHGTALLFISHDLGVVHHVADRVLVMKSGQVVEAGEVQTVFAAPRHAYTRALLDALPVLPTPDAAQADWREPLRAIA